MQLKRLIILFFIFLFLQNQFGLYANAAECENFGKEINENYEPIIPWETKNNIGIYWAYAWNQDKKKTKIDRDKNKFPKVRLSLLEKKLSPGTVVKTLNDKDLSEIDDSSLLNLIENSNFAEIQFFNEKKINKLTISAKEYKYLNFELDDFELHSINEVDPKDGFFSLDHTSTIFYKRPDLQEEGKLLSDSNCKKHHITKKIFYPDNWLTLVQFEKDEDKTSVEKFFSHEYGTTWLEARYKGLVKVRSKFDFYDFPFDTQVLKIQYQTNELPTVEGSQVILITPDDDVPISLNKFKSHNYLQEWTVSKTYISSNFVKEKNLLFDRLTLFIEIERNSKYYWFKIIIPVLLILAIAWSVLWIPTDQIESRLTTSIVALLSLIAYNFVFQEDIPKLDILTSLDKFILLSYTFCAIPIFTTIFLSRFVDRNQKRASKRNSIIRTIGGVIYIFTTLIILIIRPVS
jgi:hypothetical protein|tara:strand:+ start:2404 stop:3783 length:1380 start_codon:yes stop_codon:yes gene_type:complete